MDYETKESSWQFIDGNSTLMLVTAHLQHVAEIKRGSVRYLKMGRFKDRIKIKQWKNNFFNTLTVC